LGLKGFVVVVSEECLLWCWAGAKGSASPCCFYSLLNEMARSSPALFEEKMGGTFKSKYIRTW